MARFADYGLFVNLRGERTRNHVVEWEHMPMEFGESTFMQILSGK